MTVAEGVIVDTAQLWPNRCVFDGETHGPFLDTLTEGPNGERNYVCQRCAGLLAVRFGLVAGEELERLRNVEGEASRARLELAAAQGVQAAAEEELRLERLRSQGLEDQLTVRGQQVTELERKLGAIRGEVGSIVTEPMPLLRDPPYAAELEQAVAEIPDDQTATERAVEGTCDTIGQGIDGSATRCERERFHDGAHGQFAEGQFAAFQGPPPNPGEIAAGAVAREAPEFSQPPAVMGCAVNGCALPLGHGGQHGFVHPAEGWTVIDAPANPPLEQHDPGPELPPGVPYTGPSPEEELVDKVIEERFPLANETAEVGGPIVHYERDPETDEIHEVPPPEEPEQEGPAQPGEIQAAPPPEGRPQALSGFLERARERAERAKGGDGP